MLKLNFDGPDAACHSLRVLAEKVRKGEMHVLEGAMPYYRGPTIVLTICQTKEAELGPARGI